MANPRFLPASDFIQRKRNFFTTTSGRKLPRRRLTLMSSAKLILTSSSHGIFKVFLYIYIYTADHFFVLSLVVVVIVVVDQNYIYLCCCLAFAEMCKIGSTPQNDWYFFSHKDKKYPTGTRTNRATAAGFWKATGRDKIIYSGFRRIGLRKTLVFYKGRAPHGQKSDWIMHEYRLDESVHETSVSLFLLINYHNHYLFIYFLIFLSSHSWYIYIHICIQVSNSVGESMIGEDGWVVCRVFKKKNFQKALESPKASPISMETNTQIRNDGVLDQILLYMGRSCKPENEPFGNLNISDNSGTNNMIFLTAKHTSSSIGDHHHQGQLHDRFMHLPRLDSPTLHSLPMSNSSPFDQDHDHDHDHDHHHSLKACYQSFDEMLTETEPSFTNQAGGCSETTPGDDDPKTRLNDWVAFDRLVASQLNGQEETAKQLSCFTDPNMAFCPPPDDDVVQLSTDIRSSRLSQISNVYNSANDIWSFTKSSSSPSSTSDPLSHLSI